MKKVMLLGSIKIRMRKTSGAIGSGKMRKVKKKAKPKLRERNKNRGKRGKERRRKKRTKRRQSKEDVRVVFLWMPLKFLVKEEIRRVVVICLGWIFWRSARTCLIMSLILVRMSVWCLM